MENLAFVQEDGGVLRYAQGHVREFQHSSLSRISRNIVGPALPRKEVFGSTELDKYHTNFSWDIGDFDILFPVTIEDENSGHNIRFSEVRSPTFILGETTDYESEWGLVGTLSHVQSRWYLGLYMVLIKEEDSSKKKNLDCFINIVNKNGENLERGHLSQTFDKVNSSWGWNTYKDLQSIYIPQRDNFIGPENVLHVLAEVTLFGEIQSKKKCRHEEMTLELHIQKEATLLGHRVKMKSLLNSGAFSDAVIVCEGKEFPVHVNILSTQSEVFEKMFGTEMTEGLTRRLEVHGVEKDTFELLLVYLYTGDICSLLLSLGGSITKTSQMIQAADMYLLSDLKESCFLYLVNKVTNDSAGELARLVYFYSPSKAVSKAVTHYCQDQWTSLSRNQNFLNCVSETPEAFQKIIQSGDGTPSSYYLYPPYLFNNSGLRRSGSSTPGWKIPFVLKVMVASYFIGLAAKALSKD